MQPNTQLSVERVRTGAVRDLFWVGKCHRLVAIGWSLGHQMRTDRGEIGGRIGNQIGARGDRVGLGRWSLEGLLNLGVRFYWFRSDHNGGATSPEGEPTRRAFLTVRYGENRRHRRHRQTAQTATEARLRIGDP